MSKSPRQMHMLPHVRAFFEACRYPEPKRGQRVKMLTLSNCAIPGMNREVREADGLMPSTLFCGSQKQCLQWIADNELECVNLDAWVNR